MQLSDRTHEDILAELSVIEGVAVKLRELFQYAPSDPRYFKREIFVALASKLAQQVKAITVLHKASCLEEAVGVSRVLVEVVINALYLQECDDQEVQSFLYFDNQKISERLARNAIRDNDELAQKKNEAERARLELITGKIGNELTWSRRSLAKRAAFFDEKQTLKVLATLHDVSSRLSNFAMHGTFISLIHHFSGNTNVSDEPHRRRMFGEALYNTYRALQAFDDFARAYAISDGVFSED